MKAKRAKTTKKTHRSGLAAFRKRVVAKVEEKYQRSSPQERAIIQRGARKIIEVLSPDKADNKSKKVKRKR